MIASTSSIWHDSASGAVHGVDVMSLKSTGRLHTHAPKLQLPVLGGRTLVHVIGDMVQRGSEVVQRGSEVAAVVQRGSEVVQRGAKLVQRGSEVV